MRGWILVTVEAELSLEPPPQPASMPPIKLNAKVLQSFVFTVLSSINSWYRACQLLPISCLFCSRNKECVCVK